MTAEAPECQIVTSEDQRVALVFAGDWTEGTEHPDTSRLRQLLRGTHALEVTADGKGLGKWDSLLVAFLLRCHEDCLRQGIAFSTRDMPEGVVRLLAVATAVARHEAPQASSKPWYAVLDPGQLWSEVRDRILESLQFIGEVAIALARLATGRSNTRLSDFLDFCHQAGPGAFAIISLTSVLVGMILAYLGAVQLQQFGAGIYVADLVVIGMLREMGALMTAVVMAGRTGAAYAAQLGTMQSNDEIDAIRTMGISPVEFLVLPRMLALIAIMPLLTIYADVLGIVGGGIVAGGLGVSPIQYVNQGLTALSGTHVMVGIVKAFVFAALIAVAGCRAGINSGRSSAAVGQVATEAVVTAIVYLIVADAAINIFFQQVGL